MEQTPGQRLRADRKKADLTAAELGRRAAMVLGRDKEISESAVRNQENGTNGVPSKVAEAYAKVLKTDPSRYLLKEAKLTVAGPSPLGAELRQVAVVGNVQAGDWTSVTFTEEEDPSEYVGVDLPAFRRASLFAVRVVGRSMDLEYPEGTRVIVCPVAEYGVRDGDHVLVRRHRGSGAETTIKEIHQDGQDALLYPRSSDAAHQTPIRVKGARFADEGVEIIGVVVASQRLRPAQAGPLIIFGEAG